MIKCSVSAPAIDSRRVDQHVPLAKKQAINDNRKPVARKMAPRRRLPICRRTIPVTSTTGDVLPVAKRTLGDKKPSAKEAPPETIDTAVSSKNGCIADVSPLKDGKTAARWRLDVVQQESNGATSNRASLLPGAPDASTVFTLTKDISGNNLLDDEHKRLADNVSKKGPPSDDDTAATGSTTKESTNTCSTEVITVDSNHFLAQKWWREKTVTKKSSVSLAFNIEHCVQISNSNNNSAAATATVTERPSKTKLRPRNSILEITCPVCKKTLNKLKSGTAVTEDQMSFHVKRCSRKLFAESVPESSQSSDDAEEKKEASNLAVVAALSRPRHQGNNLHTKLEREKEEQLRKGRRAAEFAARKASLYFLTNGEESVVLDRWALGEGPGAFKKPT